MSVQRRRVWRAKCPLCGLEDNRSWLIKPANLDLVCAECDVPLKFVWKMERVAFHHNHSKPSRYSQKGFTPGYQEAFGQHVESAAHFKHLQEVHGTEDADPRIKDNIPRDFK